MEIKRVVLARLYHAVHFGKFALIGVLCKWLRNIELPFLIGKHYFLTPKIVAKFGN